MGLSRPARIKILLVIDTAFFFVELIVGMTSSTEILVLRADSLQDMPSDRWPLSLIVSTCSSKFSRKIHTLPNLLLQRCFIPRCCPLRHKGNFFPFLTLITVDPCS